MRDYAVGDTVEVLTGVFLGSKGEITTIVPTQPKSLGVELVVKGKSLLHMTWFRPSEIQ